MKHFLSAFVLMLFFSCGKSDLSKPAPPSLPQVVAFSSNNISVNNFTAQTDNNAIKVGFTTTYQKDIKSLEILRGYSSTQLCSIYKMPVTEDSYTTQHYITEDTTALSSPTLYYIIKYTLQDNDWGYTPVFTYQTGQ